MAFLTLQHFRNTCAACGLYFETLGTSGGYGGPFLYYSDEGEIWFIDPDADPVWKEVDALVTELTARARDDIYYSEVFHEVLASTTDRPRPAARSASDCPCPRCGSRERAEFGIFEPGRFSTVDVPQVTHRVWAALPPQTKRDLVMDIVRACAVSAIEEAVHRETRAWDTQDLDLLVMAVFHPDMVWPWPPHKDAHDPMEWVIPWGRYNEQRWRARWGELFASHELVHNRRVIRRIEATTEGDGGFAVVDVDTLWRDRHGNEFNWFGRACKIYTLVDSRWMMIAQTGLLEYPGMGAP